VSIDYHLTTELDQLLGIVYDLNRSWLLIVEEERKRTKNNLSYPAGVLNHSHQFEVSIVDMCPAFDILD